MSIITSDSFLFNGINSRDYGIMIAGLDSSDTDVSVNGLNREIRKNADKNKLRHTIYGAEHTASTLTLCGEAMAYVRANWSSPSAPASQSTMIFLTVSD